MLLPAEVPDRAHHARNILVGEHAIAMAILEQVLKNPLFIRDHERG